MERLGVLRAIELRVGELRAGGHHVQPRAHRGAHVRERLVEPARTGVEQDAAPRAGERLREVVLDAQLGGRRDTEEGVERATCEGAIPIDHRDELEVVAQDGRPGDRLADVAEP
jgi:hypothetical protein